MRATFGGPRFFSCAGVRTARRLVDLPLNIHLARWKPTAQIDSDGVAFLRIDNTRGRLVGPREEPVRLYTTFEQRTEQWHALRASCFITGSMLAPAIGESPFKTPAQAFDEVMARMEGKPRTLDENNEALVWGQTHEEDATREYMRVTGNVVVPLTFAQRGGDPRVGGSPDGVVVRRRDKHLPKVKPSVRTTLSSFGVLEVKCPYRRILLKSLPIYYKSQVMSHMYLTGANWCDFASYVPPSDSIPAQINILRIRYDKVYFQKVLQRVEEFAQCVASKKPPTWGYSRL